MLTHRGRPVPGLVPAYHRGPVVGSGHSQALLLGADKLRTDGELTSPLILCPWCRCVWTPRSTLTSRSTRPSAAAGPAATRGSRWRECKGAQGAGGLGCGVLVNRAECEGWSILPACELAPELMGQVCRAAAAAGARPAAARPAWGIALVLLAAAAAQASILRAMCLRSPGAQQASPRPPLAVLQPEGWRRRR